MVALLSLRFMSLGDVEDFFVDEDEEVLSDAYTLSACLCINFLLFLRLVTLPLFHFWENLFGEFLCQLPFSLCWTPWRKGFYFHYQNGLVSSVHLLLYQLYYCQPLMMNIMNIFKSLCCNMMLSWQTSRKESEWGTSLKPDRSKLGEFSTRSMEILWNKICKVSKVFGYVAGVDFSQYLVSWVKWVRFFE